MAEHSAVNRRVVGSSPTWGAKRKQPSLYKLGCFFVYFRTDFNAFSFRKGITH